MVSSITFTKVWKSDQRKYQCIAKNIVGKAEKNYLVTVVSPERVTDWLPITLISSGVTAGLLGLILTPAALLAYRKAKKVR